MFALHELPPPLQNAVRELYGDALRLAFTASSSFALLAFLFSLAHRTKSLQRRCGNKPINNRIEDGKDAERC